MIERFINKLIKFVGEEDYYFIVHKKNEYNTTGKTELHSLESIEPILTGSYKIIKALIYTKYEKIFYY